MVLPPRLFTIAAALAIMPIASAGCTYETVVWSQWDQLRSLPGQATGASSNAILAGSGGAGMANLDQPSWGIAIRNFTDGDEIEQRRAASTWVKKVKADTNIPNIWIATWDNRTTVYRGRYTDVKSDAAASDLRQTRLIRYKGLRRFRDANFERVDHLLRQTAESTDATDPTDLRRYFGKDLWSLQIAVYDENFGANHQQAAEAYVAELRDSGEQAFYFHAPSGRTMITVGIFTYGEAWTHPSSAQAEVAQQDVYSAAVRELQDRFPHNLLNEMPITDKSPDGQTIGAQPSVLVKLK